MSDRVGRCHDCTAPQTEVNMLSRHILELQADKGRLIDKVSELEAQIEKMKGLFNELVIALSTMKNGEKYNVSLLVDARKLLEELKEIKEK